jgi:hypothetical protein
LKRPADAAHEFADAIETALHALRQSAPGAITTEGVRA